jgi:hypothetical protein
MMAVQSCLWELAAGFSLLVNPIYVENEVCCLFKNSTAQHIVCTELNAM